MQSCAQLEARAPLDLTKPLPCQSVALTKTLIYYHPRNEPLYVSWLAKIKPFESHPPLLVFEIIQGCT